MGWNGSGSPNSRLPRKSSNVKGSGVVRGTIAAAFVVICGIVVFWLVRSKEEPTERIAKPAKSQSFKEVQPHLAPRQEVVEQIEEPSTIPYWERDTTNGLTRRQLMKWHIHHSPPAGITNNTSLIEEKPAYEIFDHRSENAIAAILTVPPGTVAVGDPGYERWFVADFLKSIETPIVVTKDDTPEQAQLKRDMIAVKLDLKARYDAGEDIAEIMSETRREMQKLANYKHEIEKTFREMTRQEGLTEQDVDALLEATNKLLENKGVAPLKLGPLAKLRILRQSNGIYGAGK